MRECASHVEVDGLAFPLDASSESSLALSLDAASPLALADSVASPLPAPTEEDIELGHLQVSVEFVKFVTVLSVLPDVFVLPVTFVQVDSVVLEKCVVLLVVVELEVEDEVEEEEVVVFVVDDRLVK